MSDLFTDPAAVEAMRDAYVFQDVRIAEWLERELPPLSDFEYECFRSCRAMNAAGMPVDLDLVHACIKLGLDASSKAVERFTKATGGIAPTQRAKAQAWFAAAGVEFENMQKATLEDAIRKGAVPADLAGAVDDYIFVGAKPYQRFQEILARVSSDGRLRGAIVHATAHTGRDSSRGVNLQNAKRPSLDRAGQMALAEAILQGASVSQIEAMFGPIALAVTDLQRAVFKAPAGQMFADGDFSKAEPMVAYWLTGEKDSDMPYHDLGVRIVNGIIRAQPESSWRKIPIIADLNLPTGVSEVERKHIGKNNIFYTAAKAAALGGGYGQKAKGLKESLAGKGIHITQDVAEAATKATREAKPKTFGLADDIIKAFALACGGRTSQFCVGRVIIRPYADGVEMALPSGRAIRYRKIKTHFTQGPYGTRRLNITYTPGRETTSTGKSLVQLVHAGTILENLMSAIARDFLYCAINRAVAAGIEVVLGVHDQILALVSAEAERQKLQDIMNAPPEWARGFAMSADVELTSRFTK